MRIALAQVNPIVGDLSGNRPEDSPEWKVSLLTSYTFDLGDLGQITPTLEFTWTDDFFRRPFNNSTVDLIDAYTKRIMVRMGLISLKASGKKTGYEECQSRFQESLPADVQLYNEYHALLDQHAKVACAKVPRCVDCCLLDLCLTGRSLIPAPPAEDAKSD